MGQCRSRIRLLPNKERDELLLRYVGMRTALALSEDELWRLYLAFKDANVSEGGHVSLGELLAWLEADRTPFSERVFDLFADHADGISFRGFVVSAWNMCSRDAEGLAVFAFQMYDRKQGGSLGVADVRLLLREVYGSAYATNPLASDIERKMVVYDFRGAAVSADVTLSKFVVVTRGAATLLYPAFELQRRIQEHTLGEAAWERATARRAVLAREGKFDIKGIVDLMNEGRAKRKGVVPVSAAHFMPYHEVFGQAKSLVLPGLHRPASHGLAQDADGPGKHDATGHDDEELAPSRGMFRTPDVGGVGGASMGALRKQVVAGISRLSRDGAAASSLSGSGGSWWGRSRSSRGSGSGLPASAGGMGNTARVVPISPASPASGPLSPSAAFHGHELAGMAVRRRSSMAAGGTSGRLGAAAAGAAADAQLAVVAPGAAAGAARRASLAGGLAGGGGGGGIYVPGRRRSIASVEPLRIDVSRPGFGDGAGAELGGRTAAGRSDVTGGGAGTSSGRRASIAQAQGADLLRAAVRRGSVMG
jgi:Ca2+-binding EF-hand superfamily protein